MHFSSIKQGIEFKLESVLPMSYVLPSVACLLEKDKKGDKYLSNLMVPSNHAVLTILLFIFHIYDGFIYENIFGWYILFYECNVLHSFFSLHSLFLFIHIDIVLSLWMILMDISWILQTQILFPNHCLHLSCFHFKQHWWILCAHASVSQITIITSAFWIIYVSWNGRMLFSPYKLQVLSLLFIHKMFVFNTIPPSIYIYS